MSCRHASASLFRSSAHASAAAWAWRACSRGTLQLPCSGWAGAGMPKPWSLQAARWLPALQSMQLRLWIARQPTQASHSDLHWHT